MKRPPLWMRIKVRDEKRKFGLWLPLFLLIPLIVVILVILSPLILITVLVLWHSGKGKKILFAFRAAFVVFHEMPGLKIDIKNAERYVYISIL